MTARRGAAPLRRLEGRMSRRGLLGAGVLAGVLAASGVAIAGARRGGTLRMGLAAPLPDGDPDADWEAAPAALSQGALHATLLALGPMGALEGELAVAWETEPGARRWLLALRPGAAFHDGRPVGAADVAASLGRHREGPSGWALAGVERVEPRGHAVLVTLAAGDPDFPFLLAEPALVVAPGGRVGGVGAGLYALAPGAGRLRLERVARHWKDGRAGWFDAVEAVSLPDPEARLAALEAGAVDVVDPLPPDLARRAVAAGAVALAAQGNRQLLAAGPADRAAVAAEWGGAPAADHPLGPLHPALAALPAPSTPGARPALEPWDGCATEDATFRKALAGPWAALAGDAPLAALLAAARAAEGRARAALLGQAQARVAALRPVHVAAHVPAVTLHAPALAHGAVSALAPLDGARLAERWWFA